MFEQSDEIRDYIFPIASVVCTDKGISVKKFLGTAFLIGSNGFALTAKHVMAGQKAEKFIGIFALPGGEWYGFEVLSRSKHPVSTLAYRKELPS